MYPQSVYVSILLAFVLFGATMMMLQRGIRGVMTVIVVGWMFLPPRVGINLPGLPPFGKDAAVAYALLIGLLAAESRAVMAFRPRLLDLPMLVWVLVPMGSSLTNGLGYNDGLSEVYLRVLSWLIPYFAVRVLVRTPGDVRTAAYAFVWAGLIAAPFSLWESRMSPQLNNIVYGFQVAKFHMAVRLGGYRPMLFMRHGLEVGLWMASSSAAVVWLTIISSRRFQVLGCKAGVLTGIIVVATVLCRSLGSLVLFAGTTAAAVFVRSTGIRAAFIALLLTPSVFLAMGVTNTLPGDQLVGLFELYDSERADSLASRLNQEHVITEHAMRRPVFGWGGYNRYRPTDEYDETSPVDSMTMITLGKNGVVGLVAFLMMNLIPSLIIVLKLRGRELARPFWAPTIAVLLGVLVYALDSLFNAFATPLHVAGLGVLASVAVLVGPWKKRLAQEALAAKRTQQSNERSNNDQPEAPTEVHP